MKKLSTLLTVCLLAGSLAAQQANFRAAEKYTSANLRPTTGDLSLSFGGNGNAGWIGDFDIFWYSFKTPSGKSYYYVDAAKRTKRLLFDSKYMAAQMQLLTKKNYNFRDLPIRQITFEEKSSTKFTFVADSLKFLYDITTSRLAISDTIKRTRPERRPSWPSYSPDSTWITFGRGYDLYMMKVGDKDSVEIRLTTDGEANYGYTNASGTTEPDTTRRVAARVSWFRNSEKFYVTKTDNRLVKDLWVINTLANPRPTLQTYRYAMPGDEYVGQSELIIWDAATQKRIDVDLKKWHNQFNSVRWTPRESADRMIVTRKDRTYKNIDICLINTSTGEVKVLFSETIEPYISDESLHILNDGKDLLWISERSGWKQIYRYDGDGNLKNQITEDYFVVGGIQRIDTAARVVYFNGYGREPNVHPYYSMMYKSSFDKQGVSLLTREAANHSMSLSKSNRYFVDTYSTVDKAPKIVLKDAAGSLLMELETVDLTELLKTGWKPAEPFVVKARDGITDLYGTMYKPFDFDTTRKYPIISYVYPGPQTESGTYGFTVGGNNVALAQLGFIVVNFGHRGGSPMRDQYYHSYGYQNLRDYALEDDKYGLEQLADRFDFIDITRVGIYGHSGGGFMSTAAILTYPEFYKVAVSSAGNHDNNIYNRNWSESNNGVREIKRTVKVKDEITGEEREEVKVTYESKTKSNAELAANLRGYLLLAHGEYDNNVHPGNTSRVVEALIKANKRFDQIMIPGVAHGFDYATQYFEKMKWYYFAEHLLGDYRTNVDMNDHLYR
ncbi:MAG: DPP IV N-terminal domain-containing protein [Bacteroidales bacterium]|jgi:dipeptidyl aminopeptidase/acylaminoacyl peptidase|nr:DPP IV N-terminal domain-containing protein [Bacteroidales bacterium]